jgi:phosphinothricin acetyltransferase
MHAELEIRPSRDEDVPAIAAIYAHAVKNGLASFELEPPDEAEIAARRARLIEAGYPFLVADAGSVAGFAYLSPYRTRPAYRYTVENSIYVSPDAKGRGIGRALLGRLIDSAQQGGFRQMIAIIGDSANSASIGLHAAFGFGKVGTLAAVGFKHGRWVDSVLMQLTIGEGARSLPRG